MRRLFISRSLTLPALLALCGAFWLGAVPTGAIAQTATDNPCSLLTALEVEAVLGGPLAGPPYRANGNDPDTGGDTCRYRTADFRSIAVTVDWIYGADAFAMFSVVGNVVKDGGMGNVLTLSDGTDVTGSWDRAALFLCCEFNALRGDQRVDVDISGSEATVKQAAALADQAVQRLAAPLQIASNLGIAEAQAMDASRPVVRSACDLLARADAERLLGGPLFQDPQGKKNRCTYVWTPVGTKYQAQIELTVTWRGGFSEFRNTLSALEQGFARVTDTPLADGSSSEDRPSVFDAYSSYILGVVGVRKDVLLSIESGRKNDTAAKFLAAAAEKL
ncbi:MAG: hypothetical protein H7317_09765 [Pseudorhodobacter sp.]|nr:hypothetical protein [Pseudorhodobacter sp.]